MNKIKGSIYMDVVRLQIQAKKFIDGGKYGHAKQMIEKALKQYGHDDSVLHFQCGVANASLGYMLAAE